MSAEELTQELCSIPSIPDASAPLTASYTYHSPKPTAAGPYMLGVDEAGRGPVLGPLVYGISYCPIAYKGQLEELGFADTQRGHAVVVAEHIEWGSFQPRVVRQSDKDISSGMIRKPPVNLNKQSQDATILLIREVIQSGIELTEVYVDALGPTKPYEAYLASQFPGIEFTVTAKADSKYKIVGAASVAAKVTRDAWIDGWIFEEATRPDANPLAADDTETQQPWSSELGSGYPSDPKTQAWIKSFVDRTFGYPSLVRFSWTTIKLVLDKQAHKTDWIDDGQASLIKAFETGSGADRGRSTVTRDLCLSSINVL